MSIYSFEETPDSRAIQTDPPMLTLVYRACGETDEGVVWAYALGATSNYVTTQAGTLYRQDLQIRPAGHGLYEVSVPYGQKKRDTDSYTFNFDTAGATVKIKVARGHIESYPIGGGRPTNPHKGAIGVKPDGDVEGVEIVVPALKLNVNFKHPQGVITIAQVKNLARATGCTNALPFLDFAAGELLFLGASGSDGSEADAEVGYAFAASENVDDLSFGDITGIVKAGHAYAWVEFEDAVDGGQAATKPKRVHVERVYNSLGFAGVFGWGS